MNFSNFCTYSFKLWLLSIFLLTLPGCASIYIDSNTKEINSSQFDKKAQTHPVQLLFEFQTKGVPNARATDYLRARVLEQVKSSGLFSEVTENPAIEGRVLSITLNNVPLTDDAFSKGFVTGLTFGLAGSQVSDGYVCTAKYIQDSNGKTITKLARHALHTVMGAKGAPSNAEKAASMEEAVTKMTHQIISNVLNDVSHDSAFQ